MPPAAHASLRPRAEARGPGLGPVKACTDLQRMRGTAGSRDPRGGFTLQRTHCFAPARCDSCLNTRLFRITSVFIMGFSLLLFATFVQRHLLKLFVSAAPVEFKFHGNYQLFESSK